MGFTLIFLISVLNLVFLVGSIALANMYDNNNWYWLFGGSLLATIIILLIILITKNKAKKVDVEPTKTPSQLNQFLPKQKEKFAKTQAINIIKEVHGEELYNISEENKNVGQESQSEVYLLWGEGYYTGLVWAIGINLQNMKYSVIKGKTYEELVVTNKLALMINKLADNPEVQDVNERTIMIDPETGEKVIKTRTVSKTKKEIEQKEKDDAQSVEDNMGD